MWQIAENVETWKCQWMLEVESFLPHLGEMDGFEKTSRGRRGDVGTRRDCRGGHNAKPYRVVELSLLNWGC